MWQLGRIKAGLFVDDDFNPVPSPSRFYPMARFSLLALGFVLLASVCSSSLNIEGSSKRVLVLLDNLALRESHSFYFQQLKGEWERKDLVQWIEQR